MPRSVSAFHDIPFQECWVERGALVPAHIGPGEHQDCDIADKTGSISYEVVELFHTDFEGLIGGKCVCVFGELQEGLGFRRCYLFNNFINLILA